MKLASSLTIALLTGVIAWNQSPGQASARAATFKELKEAYDQEIGGIEAECTRNLALFPTNYLKAVDALARDMQKAGDLDGLLAARKEKERFSLDPTLAEDVFVAQPARLRDLQIEQHKILQKIPATRNEKVVATTTRYVARLENLKKALTVGGKIQEAIEVKNEIDLVSSRDGLIPAKAGEEEKPEQPKAVTPDSVRKGLVLYYSFDKDDGRKVTDRSGKGNDGVVVGAVTYGESFRGRAARFTNKDTYIVSESKDLDMNGWKGLTVSMWVLTIKPTTYAHVAGRGGWKNENVGAFELALGPQYGMGLFCVRAGRESIETVAKVAGMNVPSFLNRWRHVAGTYDGQKATYYANGVFAASRQTAAVNQPIKDNSDNALVIGTVNRTPIINWSDMYFDGMIDEVMIFNIALSADDIKKLYDSRKPEDDEEVEAGEEDKDKKEDADRKEQPPTAFEKKEKPKQHKKGGGVYKK